MKLFGARNTVFAGDEPPIPNFSYMQGRKQEGAATKVFVVCTPKSGSSFLVTLLQKLTGYGPYSPIFGGEPMLEADPYLPDMMANASTSTVSQLHCYAKPRNLALCNMFSIKPVFLTRNIFDSLLSMKEYIDNVPHPQLFPHYYELSDDEHRNEFILNVYAPIFVRLAAGWYDAMKSGHPVLWSTYEDFFRDQVTETRRIGTHLGLSFSPDAIQTALDRTRTDPVTTKLNHGVVGRGLTAFTRQEQYRVYELIESFAGFDPVEAGLIE